MSALTGAKAVELSVSKNKHTSINVQWMKD